jgi:hypothetical protein
MQLFPPPFVPPEVDDILRGMPSNTDYDAWLDPAVQQRVFQCVEAESNLRHTYTEAVNIEAVHTDTEHYYKYKGVKKDTWPSPSRFNDGKLFPPFEANTIAEKLSKIKNKDSVWFERKSDDILKTWKQIAIDGRAKHAFFDMKIQQPDVEIPAMIPEAVDVNAPASVLPKFFKRVDPTPAFYRCMANILRDFVIWATEVTLYDEDWEIVGQADLILQDRLTGELVIADWKNCGTSNLGDVTKSFGKMGCHVSTAHLPATKLNKYLVQTTIYRKMAKRRTHGEWPPFAKRVILYNFNPDTPNEYETYDRPSLDLKLFFQRLPWRDADPEHFNYSILPTLVPRYAMDPVSARPCRTKRVCIKPGMWCDPNVAWVGRQYPSINAKKEANEKIDEAIEAGDIDMANEIYEGYDAQRTRYTLKNSPYHHPWYWKSGTDPDPPGCNAYYEWWLLNNRKALLKLPEYVGKSIACWCGPMEKGCHADIFTFYLRAWERGDWRPDLSEAALFPDKPVKSTKKTRQKKNKAVVPDDDDPF